MTVSDLQDFYDYSYWANRRLLQVIARLTPEEFTRTVAGSYGSVRNTLVHVLSAEWGWLDRCGGPSRPGKLRPEDFSTLESLISTWDQVEGYMRGFLSGLRDDDLTRIVEYPGEGGAVRAMPMGPLLHHGIIHAAHHRGQVALLLRALGHSPGNFDLVIYSGERLGVPAW
jgi:uncharacterized damage-inducible protein DinB